MEKDPGNAMTQIEIFRNAKDSETLRDALAFLSIHLLDPYQRESFRKCDGGTTLGKKTLLRRLAEFS